VQVISYKTKVTVPFKAYFKIGFSGSFDTGTESWFESGTYTGVDDSNIKLHLSCVKMPVARKVSRMINGLGEDM